MRTGDPEETKPSGGREKLVGEIVGVSSCTSFFLFLFASPPELDECFQVPAPNGRAGKTFSTYVRAQLFHASGDLEWRSKSIKTQHSIETGANVIWQSQFEWEYENDEMAFLR
jgi:phosphatidylinositol phospholipase C delta